MERSSKEIEEERLAHKARGARAWDGRRAAAFYLERTGGYAAF